MVIVGPCAMPYQGVTVRDERVKDMLRVTVLGNLGSDAELRYSTKGTQIAGFRIAVNQVRTNANGQREDSTEWFRINVAGRQADYASHLQKGQRWLLVDSRSAISSAKMGSKAPASMSGLTKSRPSAAAALHRTARTVARW